MREIKTWILAKLLDKHGINKQTNLFKLQQNKLGNPFLTIESMRTALDRYCERIATANRGNVVTENGNDRRFNMLLGFSTIHQCASAFKASQDGIDYTSYPDALLDRIGRSYEKDGDHRSALSVLHVLAGRMQSDPFVIAKLEQRIANLHELVGEGEKAEERYTNARKIIDRIPAAESELRHVELRSRIELGCEIARWRRSGRASGVLDVIRSLRESISTLEKKLKAEINAVGRTKFILAHAHLFRVEASIQRIHGDYERAKIAIETSRERFQTYRDCQSLMRCDLERFQLARSFTVGQPHRPAGTKLKSQNDLLEESILGAFHMKWERLARQSDLVYLDANGNSKVSGEHPHLDEWSIDDRIHAFIVLGRIGITSNDFVVAYDSFKRAIELIDYNTEGRSLLRAVAEFGRYETVRLAPNWNKEEHYQPEKSLNALHANFLSFGCRWGIARTLWLQRARSKEISIDDSFEFSGNDSAILRSPVGEYSGKTLFDLVITLGQL